MLKNKHLTLGGLFAALHLLFILLSRVLVGSELILVIFLPLLSTIYSIQFKKKEVTIFFVATFLLCVLFEPISTFIYIVPALICGTVYGELRKTKVRELSLVYFTTLSHSISLLISFLSINAMFKEVNFFSIFESFIDKKGDSFYLSIYLILVFLGLLESFATHIISNNELLKLGYKPLENEEITPRWMVFGVVICGLSYFILALINPLYTVYVFPFLVACSIPIVIEFIINNKNKWLYGLVGVMVVCAIFAMGVMNKIFYPLLMIMVFSPILLEKIVRVLYTFLPKYSNNGKNNIE